MACCRCIRRIEIKDAHKVFMLKVVVRVKSAAIQQGITDADLRGVSKSHLDVEFIIFGAGCCIRPLRMNHDLLMIGVLIQTRGCHQEGLPAFQSSRQLALRLLRHAAIFLQFTCHRLVLLSRPFTRAKEKKHLFRCSSYT